MSAPSGQDNTAVPAVMIPGTGGAVWTGPGTSSGVLLSTPTASFPTPPPAVGISDAGRAGISNSVPVNGNLQGTQTISPTFYAYSGVSPAGEAAPEVSPATEAVSTEPSHNDLLPSYFSNNLNSSASNNGRSLGEIAARYRSQQGTQSVRTYTNADVPHENAGLLTKIWVAEGKLPPGADNSETLMASAVPPRPIRPDRATAEQPAQTDDAATQQSQPKSGHSELPASSTMLPLLGLLGLASGGIGLLFRRRR